MLLAMPIAYPDPPLEQNGLRLRPWSLGDVDDVVRCCNEEQVRRFLPPIPIPYTPLDAEEFITGADDLLERDSLTMVTSDAASGALRGAVGMRLLEPEVVQFGYWVDPEACGRGVATTALTLISRWALRELAPARLQLFTDVENDVSMRVAERAGFTREGLLRNWYDLRGERRDAVMFSLLPGDAG
jgi:[ribosomal protein S5]-alanine N-acetyltransferase